MLQSMTVFLLVFMMIKGRWMTEFSGGGLFVCCSVWRLRCTRFLNAICWTNIRKNSALIWRTIILTHTWPTFRVHKLPVKWVLGVVTVFAWFSLNVFASPPTREKATLRSTAVQHPHEQLIFHFMQSWHKCVQTNVFSMLCIGWCSTLVLMLCCPGYHI